jgi:arylsulfatase A-like enzyme
MISAQLAIAAAVLTEFLFDVGFSIARGTELHLEYLILCGSWMVLAGIACAAIATGVRSSTPRAALALYVALHGFADPMADLPQAFSGLAMAFITWMMLARPSGSALRPAVQGTIVAAALCFAIVLLPYLVGMLPFVSLGLLTMSAVQATGYGLALAALRGGRSLRRRIPAIPGPALLSLTLLGSTIGTAALAFEYLRPQSRSIPASPAATRPAPLPDVFVLVLDTVRADHLTPYGYARDTTPKLAQFLSQHSEAVQYDLAFAPASWTVPSHASLLTGTMPSQHQARSTRGKSFSYSATRSIALSAKETLAELLSSAGYCTSAVVANAYLLRVDGLQRGFEAFFQPHAIRPLLLLGQGLRRRFTPGAYAGWIKPYPRANVVDSQVLRMVHECGPRPAFVLANYMDAHSPYLAPSPHSGMFAGRDEPEIALENAVLTDSIAVETLKRDRYDENLHFLDHWLGRLFAALESEGVLDSAWLFITADHGEAFREHGTSAHGSSIYNEQVRIPLIVKPPRGVALPRTREPVSLLDVTATIAAIAGRDGFGNGHDLRSPPPPGRVVEVEFRGGFRNNREQFGATSNQPAVAAIRGDWKLIERSGRYELYDLASDLHEQTDRSAERSDVLRALAPRLPELNLGDEPVTGGNLQPLGRDEKEALRELGYIE